MVKCSTRFDLQVTPLDPRMPSLRRGFDDAEAESRPDVLVVDVARRIPLELDAIRSCDEQATLPLPPIVLLVPAGQVDCSERCEELRHRALPDEAGQATRAGSGDQRGAGQPKTSSAEVGERCWRCDAADRCAC